MLQIHLNVSDIDCLLFANVEKHSLIRMTNGFSVVRL